MKTDKSAAQQILKSSSNRKIISTWSKNRARISGERLQRWRKLNWPANYANMDDDRWKRITEETIYYRFMISPFKIRIYDRRLKMIPVLLINNRRSKRTTASPFTFRQLISHRRFRDISLSLPFLRISRAQLTRLRLIMQGSRFHRVEFCPAINSRYLWSGSNWIFTRRDSLMHNNNFNEIHLWIYIYFFFNFDPRQLLVKCFLLKLRRIIDSIFWRKKIDFSIWNYKYHTKRRDLDFNSIPSFLNHYKPL